MSIIIYILCLVCAFLMFIVKPNIKVMLLLLSYQFASFVVIPFIPQPFGRTYFLIPFCFILSELQNIRFYIKSLKNTVVWRITGVFLFSIVLLIITSPHLHSIGGIRLVLQEEVFFKCFVLLYSFVIIRTDDNLIPLIKASYYSVIVMTLIGIINYYTQSSFYVGWFSDALDDLHLGTGSAQQLFDFSIRKRVNSTFLNPFDYGYMCALMMLFFLYVFSKKMINRQKLIIVIVCCLFGIFSCGSRTVMISTIVAIIVYLLCWGSFKNSINYSLIFVALFMLSYQFVPAVRDKLEFAISAFDKNSVESGSTLEGREIQLAAVMHHLSGHEALGRGYMYFEEDLGYSKGADNLVDKDLYGLESVIFKHLLERGVVGLLMYFLYFAILFFFLYKKRKDYKQETSISISLLVLYMTFAIMTGELGSVKPTFLLLGYPIYSIYKKLNYANT